MLEQLVRRRSPEFALPPSNSPDALVQVHSHLPRSVLTALLTVSSLMSGYSLWLRWASSRQAARGCASFWVCVSTVARWAGVGRDSVPCRGCIV